MSHRARSVPSGYGRRRLRDALDLRMRNQFGGWVRARHEVSGIFGGNCADLHFSSDGRWFAASDDCGTIALIGLRDTADSFESRQVAVIRGLHTSGTVYPIAFGFGENDATVIVNGDEVYLFDLDAELLDSLELTISLPRD